MAGDRRGWPGRSSYISLPSSPVFLVRRGALFPVLRDRIERLEFVPELPLSAYSWIYLVRYLEDADSKCIKHGESVGFDDGYLCIWGTKHTFLINWKDRSLSPPAFVKYFALEEAYDAQLAAHVTQLLIHPIILYASIFVTCQLLWFLREECTVLNPN